jgi:hypothetical protein
MQLEYALMDANDILFANNDTRTNDLCSIQKSTITSNIFRVYKC